MALLSYTWRNLPLGSKLTLITSTLIVLVVFSVMTLSVQRERQSFQNELEAQVELLLDTIPLTIRDELYLVELDEIADAASVVRENPSVTTLIVYDAEGRILVNTDDEGLSFSRAIDPMGVELTQLSTGQSYTEWQADELVAGRAVRLGNQVIGAVLIGLSNQPLMAKIAALRAQSLFLALVTVILAAIITFLFSREITTPLRLLADSAETMAGGDLDARAEIKTGGEIGQLGAAFDAMATAIAHREQELVDLNLSLEAKVEERTRELSEANELLVSARNEALDASRFKTQLLANVSHDLRTPLNVILGYGEMLRTGEYGALSERGDQMAREIIKSVGHLLQFVNNLLDQAQIESGKVRLNQMPFEPQTLLDNAVSVTHSLASAKGLALEVELDNSMPGWIIGDLNWLYQILYNLISNAIKFTDEGSVKIRFYAPDADHWVMEVRDTGIGIPPEVHKTVFDAFYQVDGSVTRKKVGSGLGLSIVHQLATLMDGTVELDSRPGKGSTFQVILPLEKVEYSHE